MGAPDLPDRVPSFPLPRNLQSVVNPIADRMFMTSSRECRHRLFSSVFVDELKRSPLPENRDRWRQKFDDEIIGDLTDRHAFRVP